MRHILLLTVVWGILAGCSSTRATYLGNPANGDRAAGIPIVVERPRYLKVTEREVEYTIVAGRQAGLQGNPQLPANNPNPGAATPPNTPGAVLGTRRGVLVDYEVVSVGEVYAVDFRRPGAGKGEFTMEFADGRQYPSKITGKSEDETLKQVGEALATLIEKGVKGLTPTSGELADAIEAAGAQAQILETTTRVLRVRLFDLDQLTNSSYQPTVLYSAP